jgi:hypothetical protein
MDAHGHPSCCAPARTTTRPLLLPGLNPIPLTNPPARAKHQSKLPRTLLGPFLALPACPRAARWKEAS